MMNKKFEKILSRLKIFKVSFTDADLDALYFRIVSEGVASLTDNETDLYLKEKSSQGTQLGKDGRKIALIIYDKGLKRVFEEERNKKSIQVGKLLDNFRKESENGIHELLTKEQKHDETIKEDVFDDAIIRMIYSIIKEQYRGGYFIAYFKGKCMNALQDLLQEKNEIKDNEGEDTIFNQYDIEQIEEVKLTQLKQDVSDVYIDAIRYLKGENQAEVLLGCLEYQSLTKEDKRGMREAEYVGLILNLNEGNVKTIKSRANAEIIKIIKKSFLFIVPFWFNNFIKNLINSLFFNF